MPDIIEDLFAFLCVTEPDRPQCPTCGAELEEADDGELYCPTCDH